MPPLLSKEVIMEEMDRCLHVPGFWSPVKLGVLHRLHVLRCDEELAQCVKYINETWEPVFRCLDKDVWASWRWQRPSTQRDNSGHGKRIVISLCRRPANETFFNNLTYMEPCAMVLKGIMDARPKYSIRRSFGAAFKCPQELYVEEADSKFCRYGVLEADEAFDCSYLQLWLYAMRNFPEMTRITVKKEVMEPRRYANEPNAWLWHDFAALAARLGFSTTRINEILSTNPSMVHARRILLEARPSDKYCFDDGGLELYTRRISEMITSAKSYPLPMARFLYLRRTRRHVTVDVVDHMSILMPQTKISCSYQLSRALWETSDL